MSARPNRLTCHSEKHPERSTAKSKDATRNLSRGRRRDWLSQRFLGLRPRKDIPYTQEDTLCYVLSFNG